MSEDQTLPIDACWKQIGIWGDRSCERLKELVHCHNCDRYSAAAIELLDRYDLVREQAQITAPESLVGSSHIVFRVSDQWLALPSKVLVEVAMIKPIHRLPHQRNAALLGVSNVRGALVACLSLAELLSIESTESNPTAKRVLPRMLVLSAEGGPVVVPVDEVAGIERLDTGACSQVQTTEQHNLSSYALGVLNHQGRSVTILFDDKLFAAVKGALL